MGDRDGSQSNSFHTAVCVGQEVELDLHLTCLRAMEVSFIEEAFDICFYKKGELEW